MLPCAVGLRDNLCDSPTHMSELVQESFVVALVVQQGASSSADNEEVCTQGQACNIAWGSRRGHLEGALALLLPSIEYWVHSYPACRQPQTGHRNRKDDGVDSKAQCFQSTKLTSCNMSASRLHMFSHNMHVLRPTGQNDVWAPSNMAAAQSAFRCMASTLPR